MNDAELMLAVDDFATKMVEQSKAGARAFIVELRQLCQKHKIQICTSDYDSIQLWRLEDGEPEVYPDFDDDETVRG